MNRLCLAAAFVLFSKILWAAPPLDLTDQTGELAKRPPKTKAISEEEITFTDANERQIEAARKAEGLLPILYPIVARSQPTREGDEIQSLKKGELVKLLGQSKSGRWLAIELMRGKRTKAWVPRSALQVPPTKPSPRSSKP